MIKKIKDGSKEVTTDILSGVKEGCACLFEDTTRPTRDVVTDIYTGIQEGYAELREMVAKPLHILSVKMMGSYTEIEALESKEK